MSLIKLKLKDIQKPISKFIKEHEISLITGMPGTGKDFICMHTALSLITDKKSGYEKIIITKPIVETGRSMGFLKGDTDDKIKPYRASFDDLVNQILGKGSSRALENIKKKIVFEPVNFVRGNTFKNSVVILSEAQNLTLHELMSFVTRLDKSSKMFLNGDYNQSDIGNKSGIINFENIISDVRGAGVVNLGSEHQTRNKIIIDIVNNYNLLLKKMKINKNVNS